MQQQSTLNINDRIQTTGPASDKICSNNYSKLNIDLSSVSWFEPDTLTRLKCLIDLAQKQQMEVAITPPKRGGVEDYGGRMGLFDRTLVNNQEYKYPYNRAEHESDSFFPLIKIENDRNETLQEKFLKVINPPGYKLIELSESFSEIVDNIYYHSGESENTGWGYAHAQCQYNNSEIQIAISDTGVGFLGSYKRTNQVRNRNETDIVVDAFNERESSLNNEVEECRGIGLYGLHEYIKKASGQIQVWSGNSYVEIKGKDKPIKETLSYKVVGVLFKVSLCLKIK